MGIEDDIVPGTILYFSVSFPHKSAYHDKYMVVVASGEQPLLLKINTSRTQPKSQRMRKSISSSRNPSTRFFNMDSFLDCGTVWLNIVTLDEVIAQHHKDPTRLKGAVDGRSQERNHQAHGLVEIHRASP